jgi:signal transduction histidine kinase
MLSLRARVVLGAIFWTVGLVIIFTALLVAAIEHSGEVRRFIGVHGFFLHPLILLLAVASIITGAWTVRRGLSSIAVLRQRLGSVHQGQDVRVEGRFVSEVQPLVDDLNALLDHREQAVRRAVGKAGDLAHGLKTPLAVLAREAERARAGGQPDVAAAIAQQVDGMRRQIDYHLAHARAAASGATPGARCPARPSAEGLARTLLRLHADRHLSIDVRVSAAHVARVQREDLDEMLGNLLDNACKWTRTRVVVDSIETDRYLVLTIDDDGPGLAAGMREAVLIRGVRADEQASGSGFGLAIVRDIAELYNGSIAMDESPLGGLRATLTLPKS